MPAWRGQLCQRRAPMNFPPAKCQTESPSFAFPLGLISGFGHRRVMKSDRSILGVPVAIVELVECRSEKVAAAPGIGGGKMAAKN